MAAEIDGTIYLKDFAGKSVRLSAERVEHFEGRLKKAGMFDLLAQALADPDIVIRSNWDPSSVLCYRFHTGTAIGDKWLCVVVCHQESDAFVLTAYPTDQLKPGVLLWKKM